MKNLILLYWGCVVLMYLSQMYYPVELGQGKKSFMWRRADIFMVLAIFWMTCFSFLRTQYNDTFNYISGFREAPSVAQGLLSGAYIDWTGNPWSVLYRDVMRELTSNYHVYFLIPALVSSVGVIKLFKNYSVSPTFSLLIFFSIGTYVMYIAALKQCLAMFFLLLAIPYAVRRKYLRFYGLLFVAICFHTHAFLFAIVPFLLGKPWGKKTWFLLGITLLAMATYRQTFGAFMEYAQSIGALVAEIEVFDGHKINIIRVLVYWIPAAMALIFRRRLFYHSTEAENLFVNMSIVSAFILMIGLVEGANLYARMAGYFEIATAVAIPWMIQKLFTRESAKVVTNLAGAMYFGYFLFEFGVSKNFGNDYAAISLWEFLVSLF